MLRGYRSLSDFLVSANDLSDPTIEIELGGQALERWPSELFVPKAVVADALDWFIESGRRRPDLCWVRIDRFRRQTVWEGGEGREAWEASPGLEQAGSTRGGVVDGRRPGCCKTSGLATGEHLETLTFPTVPGADSRPALARRP